MCIRDRVSAGSAARPAGDGGAGPEKLDRIMARALTRPGGSFSVKCAAAANALTIDGQFPLYDILEPYRAFKKEIWPLRLPEPVCAEPENAVTGKIHGRVLDAATAAPLPGALVRAWRGVLDPSGDLMTEGFAGEARAGADGAFTLTLPAGEYLSLIHIYPLIECFAGEAVSDAGGAFAFDLPAGKYILSAVGRHDGVQYLSLIHI